LAILEGIHTLMRLYLYLGEDRAAWTVAHDLLVQLCETGLGDAWWKARNLRPKDPGDQPEEFWASAISMIKDARTHALAYSQGEARNLALCLSDAELKLIAGPTTDGSNFERDGEAETWQHLRAVSKNSITT
jgi:hypothetical protein